jgi:hypothetical protein
MGSELMLYLRKFVDDHYQINILENQKFLEKISEYVEKLQKLHLEDLSSWTIDSGKVYFSDTIAELYLKKDSSGKLFNSDPKPMKQAIY